MPSGSTGRTRLRYQIQCLAFSKHSTHIHQYDSMLKMMWSLPQRPPLLLVTRATITIITIAAASLVNRPL